MIVPIKFKRLHPAAQLPKVWSKGAVGFDLHACIISETGRVGRSILPPRTTRNFATGFAIEPPPDHYLIVCSRSGLAGHSIFVANAPGIIDTDYRGEVRVLLYNGGHDTQYIEHGQRIAQILIAPRIAAEVIEVEELSQTERGERGFGSTGE